MNFDHDPPPADPADFPPELQATLRRMSLRGRVVDQATGETVAEDGRLVVDRKLRPMPSAVGGKFHADFTNVKSAASREELDWTRAALEALHLRLNAAIAELVAASGVTGRALAAVSEEHLGTVQELMESFTLDAMNNEVYEAEQLHQALTDPDDAECTTCGSALGFFHGYSGWQHYRYVGSDLGGQKLEITEPDHPTVKRGKPRQRPAIADGAVQPD